MEDRTLAEWREILAGWEHDVACSALHVEECENDLATARIRHERNLYYVAQLKTQIAELEALQPAPEGSVAAVAPGWVTP